MIKLSTIYIFFLLVTVPGYAYSKKRCKMTEVIGRDCDYASIRFVPNVEWQSIGQYLDKDIVYKFTTHLSKDWQDDNIPANLKGWIEFKSLAKAYSVIRRAKNFGFYQIGFCETKDYLNCKSLEQAVKYHRVETKSQIHFFVNDVKNFSFNNKGIAFIRIEKAYDLN